MENTIRLEMGCMTLALMLDLLTSSGKSLSAEIGKIASIFYYKG